MSLRPDEKQAIDSLIVRLRLQTGWNWEYAPGPTLDDQYPAEPSPEVLLVAPAGETVAVEVKGLRIDEFQAAEEAHKSLVRSLRPSCGGDYTLYLGPEQITRLDLPTVRHLREGIERVAPSLRPGEETFISVRRRAPLHLTTSRVGDPYAWCCHEGPLGPLVEVIPRAELPGIVFLQDLPQPEHYVVRDSTKEAFKDAVLTRAHEVAHGKRKSGDAFFWFEDAKLGRYNAPADAADEGSIGVNVLNNAVTEAVGVVEATTLSLQTALRAAHRKFLSRRWADRHMVILLGNAWFDINGLRRCLEIIDETLFHRLDEVLVAYKQDLHSLWTRDPLRELSGT